MNGEPFCYGSRLTVRQLLELRANGYDLTGSSRTTRSCASSGIAAAYAYAADHRERYADFFEADGSLAGPGYTDGRGGRPAGPVPRVPGVVVKSESGPPADRGRAALAISAVESAKASPRRPRARHDALSARIDRWLAIARHMRTRRPRQRWSAIARPSRGRRSKPTAGPRPGSMARPTGQTDTPKPPAADAPAFDAERRATELAILDALRAVVDPEIGMNVVELALIKQIILGPD